MELHPALSIAAGAAGAALLGALSGWVSGPALADHLAQASAQAVVATGTPQISTSFRTDGGWPTRHPTLAGGEGLADPLRLRAASAVRAVPGVASVMWADGSARAAAAPPPIDCQADVNALLKTRTIRFEAASSQLDMVSRTLIDEVANALRPCAGSVISIIGHTDDSGAEADNLALSAARAEAVRQALIARGIAGSDLRSSGVGARAPVQGLKPEDPANRRIEFAVVSTRPIVPTPIDTPAAR